MASGARGRAFDLIIFGATGFTGVEVTKYLASSCNNLKWAIAGRSRSKMENLVESLKLAGLSEPNDVIIADIQNDEALQRCTEQTKLLLNCTGPYRNFGEPVVRSCLETSTDYIDLCGEPEFMERMVVNYHRKAEEKGVLIIHACAFDSIPADLGAIFTANQFKNPSSCETIESFLSIHSGPQGVRIHYTTYEALVLGFGSIGSLRRLREQSKNFYKTIERVPNSHLRRQTKPYFEQRMNLWCAPFMGSDVAVVKMSQSAIATRQNVILPQPHYGAYFTISSFFWMTVIVIMGSILQFLAKSQCGRQTLMKFPKIFTCGLASHEGPTQQQMKETSFTMRFYAKGNEEENESKIDDHLKSSLIGGNKKTEIVTEVSGPEPGYVATPIIFLDVARCLLEERERLPVSGGVFTPGAVFAESTLIERLQKSGISFRVVSDSSRL